MMVELKSNKYGYKYARIKWSHLLNRYTAIPYYEYDKPDEHTHCFYNKDTGEIKPYGKWYIRR